MADVVVDASVVVKWYIPESNHEQARALRDDYLDEAVDLRAPALLPFEVVNALNYSGYYDGDSLQEVAETLPEYGIELVPFGSLGPVATVADELDITVYDAAYVALALTGADTAYTVDGDLLSAVEDSDRSGAMAHVRTYVD